MTEALTSLFLQFLGSLGSTGYAVLSAVLTGLLCFVIIPKTTDLMVDSAAGLAGKYLGNKQRTLVINIRPNLPEFFTMVIAFAMLRIGGIATPLGSNFANLYLMFLIAPLFVLLAWAVTGKKEKLSAFKTLLSKEKGIAIWHIAAGGGLYLLSVLALYFATGVDQFKVFGGNAERSEPKWLLFTAAVCLGGLLVFLVFEKGLKSKRPELFEDIDDEGQKPSWAGFIIGTLGLILACTIMNSLFVSWEKVYGEFLQGLLGAAVFTGLQYFLGALVTSLPEMTVATRNLRRLSAPDLNTALGSASYSNMSNLAIAGIGALLAWILTLFGVALTS